MGKIIKDSIPGIRIDSQFAAWLLKAIARATDAFICSQFGLGPGWLSLLFPYRTPILRRASALCEGYVRYQLEGESLV